MKFIWCYLPQARRLRKALGGGMRQAGVIAAAGLEAVVNNFVRLEEVIGWNSPPKRLMLDPTIEKFLTRGNKDKKKHFGGDEGREQSFFCRYVQGLKKEGNMQSSTFFFLILLLQ